MKTLLTILVALVVVAGLFALMATYQVDYDEVGVLTTFKAADPPVYAQEGQPAWQGYAVRDGRPLTGSLKVQPGLYMKWPWPIQEVRTYPRQLQVLEAPLEEFQTADGHVVAAKLYLTWRVRDPYQFFKQVETIENARDRLTPLVRQLSGVMSRYRFEQYVNAGGEVDLSDIEQAMTAELTQELARLDSQGRGYGIEVAQVGLRRLVLPEQVTPEVFNRMKQTREVVASRYREMGEAAGQAIEAQANASASRLRDYAQRRAAEIRSQGEAEAAQFSDAFRQNPELAIFLAKLEGLVQSLQRNSQIVVPAQVLGAEALMTGDVDDDRAPRVIRDSSPAGSASDSADTARSPAAEEVQP